MPVPPITDEQVRALLVSTGLRFRDRLDLFFKETVRELRHDGDACVTYADLADYMRDESRRLLGNLPPALDGHLHVSCTVMEEIIRAFVDDVAHGQPQATERGVASFLIAIGTKALACRAELQEFLGTLDVSQTMSVARPLDIKDSRQPAP